MELNDFKIGDHVVLTEHQEEAPKGTTGIVRGVDVGGYGNVQVEIDEEYRFSQLHACDGVIPSSHGWNVKPHRLELIKPKKVIKLIKLSKAKRNTKIKKIIKEINSNKEYKSCFKNVFKEISSWSDVQVLNYQLDEDG